MPTSDQQKTISIPLELTETHAWHLAQFVKRVGFIEMRNNAQDVEEAYVMRDAIEALRTALMKAGYAPR